MSLSPEKIPTLFVKDFSTTLRGEGKHGKATINWEMPTFVDLPFLVYILGRPFMAHASFVRVNTPDELPTPGMRFNRRGRPPRTPSGATRYQTTQHLTTRGGVGVITDMLLTHLVWENECSPPKLHQLVHQPAQFIPLTHWGTHIVWGTGHCGGQKLSSGGRRRANN